MSNSNIEQPLSTALIFVFVPLLGNQCRFSDPTVRRSRSVQNYWSAKMENILQKRLTLRL